jgi:hypothetical protein
VPTAARLYRVAAYRWWRRRHRSLPLPIATFLQLQAIVSWALVPFTLVGALGTFVLLGVTSGLGAFRLARHAKAGTPVAAIAPAIVAGLPIATLALYAAGWVSEATASIVLVVGVLVQAVVKEKGLRRREYDLAQRGLLV